MNEFVIISVRPQDPILYLINPYGSVWCPLQSEEEPNIFDSRLKAESIVSRLSYLVDEVLNIISIEEFDMLRMIES